MKKKVMQAIELGKIWMKNSLDPVHDYDHVQRVEEHCRQIAREKDLSTYELNLLLTACWWHDSYKARKRGFTLYALFFEGYESAKIVRRELVKYLNEKELDIVANAVQSHNYSVWYFILGKGVWPLARALYEADTLDSLNIERFKGRINTNGRRLFNIGFFCYFHYRYLTLNLLLEKQSYASNILNNFKSH